MSLSAAAIKTALPGAVLRDETVPGLHLRVTPKARSFYLYFRTKTGVERRPKLGEAGVMTLAQARRLAREMLVQVAAGRDPIDERRAAKEAATMRELSERYLKEHAPRKKTGDTDRQYLERIIRPKLGGYKVQAIAHDDIHKLHLSLAKTPYQANRVLALLSKMFNAAEVWKMRPPHSNPCRHVERFPEQKRRRYLKPDELAALVAQLEKHEASNPQTVAFLWLTLLTGARKGEIGAARWNWLDGNVLRLPDSKTGARPVYLPEQAVRVLDKLPRTDGTIVGVAYPDKLWRKIRAAIGAPDLRIHDLRHSFASFGVSAGLSLTQIGELLGHKNTQTTMRYAHLMEETAHTAAASVATLIERGFNGRASTR